MGWKTVGGKRYFYEYRVEDDRSYWVCLGNGYHAQIAAREAELREEAKAADRVVVKAWTEADREIEVMTRKFDRFVQWKVSSALRSSGYHQHKGQWRKSRRKVMSEEEKKLEAVKVESEEKLAREEIENPDSFGYVLRMLTLDTLKGIQLKSGLRCKYDEAVAEVDRQVEAMRKGLNFEQANPLEKIVIEQVLTAWVQWYVAGWQFEAKSGPEVPQRQNQYLEKKYLRYQVRLTRAVDQLARLRCVPRGYLERGKK